MYATVESANASTSEFLKQAEYVAISGSADARSVGIYESTACTSFNLTDPTE
jgi:hypothetical protein